MEQVENGLPPQTWDERVAAGIVPAGAENAFNPNTP
jgi:hypothetical protein